MKTKIKNVYYCDYCKKKGLCASVMVKHEKHCTSNPKRKCRMCKEDHDYIQIAEKLKARYKIITTAGVEEMQSQKVVWIGDSITIDEIRISVDYCPACMLTVMKLAGLCDYIFYDTLYFDYKKEVADWWKEINNN